MKFIVSCFAFMLIFSAAHAQLLGFGAQGKRNKEAIKAMEQYPNGGMPPRLYESVCILPVSQMDDRELMPAIFKAYQRRVKDWKKKPEIKAARIISSDWKLEHDKYTGAILSKYITVVVAADDGKNCSAMSYNFYYDYLGGDFSSVLNCGWDTDDYPLTYINCGCLDAKYTNTAAFDSGKESNSVRPSDDSKGTTTYPLPSAEKAGQNNEVIPAPVKSPASSVEKSGKVSVDLSSAGIAAAMTVPLSVKLQNGAVKRLSDGANFNIIIEPAASTLKELKSKMLADKNNRMFLEKTDSFMYSTNINGDRAAHFEAVVTVNGKNWRLHDGGTSKLSLGVMRSMFDAAGTLK